LYPVEMADPRFLSDFTIGSLLGVGSFGVVLKCWEKENQKSLAIKVCRHNKSAKREEKSLEKIGKHRNIVDYYRSWKEDYSPKEMKTLEKLLTTCEENSKSNNK